MTMVLSVEAGSPTVELKIDPALAEILLPLIIVPALMLFPAEMDLPFTRSLPDDL